MQDCIECVYMREELLALRRMSAASVCYLIPKALRRKYQGCRARAKVKTAITNAKRRRYKPSVPSILMGNVNVLQNNVDKLVGLMKAQKL